MMLALACLLLLAAYLGYRRYRNYFAPAVISPASWGAVLFLYATLDHGMFDVSFKGIMIITLWNFSLLIGVYLFTDTNIVRIKNSLSAERPFKPWVRNLYYKISVWGLLPTLYISYKQVNSMTGDSLMFNLRMANTGTIETDYNQGIFAYVYTFAFVSYLIELYSFHRGQSKRRVIILFLINLVLSLVTMAKSSFLFLFFTSLVIVMYKRKISFKKVFLVAATMFLLMASIQLLRAGDNNEKGKVLSDMLYSYVFGGIPALDEIVNSQMSSKYPGQHSMAFMNNIQVKMGVKSDHPKEYEHDITDEGYLYTPYPTNVYTMIGLFWLDYGYKGVLWFSFVIGALAGYFYKMTMRGHTWAIVLYAYFSCVLMLQFFGEYIFTNLSYLLQLIVLSLFAYKFSYSIKWHKSTSSLPRTMEKNILNPK